MRSRSTSFRELDPGDPRALRPRRQPAAAAARVPLLRLAAHAALDRRRAEGERDRPGARPPGAKLGGAGATRAAQAAGRSRGLRAGDGGLGRRQRRRRPSRAAPGLCSTRASRTCSRPTRTARTIRRAGLQAGRRASAARRSRPGSPRPFRRALLTGDRPPPRRPGAPPVVASADGLSKPKYRFCEFAASQADRMVGRDAVGDQRSSPKSADAGSVVGQPRPGQCERSAALVRGN